MFFCLGKKERTCDVPSADLAHPPMASRAAKLRKTRRLMIYVHSKLMVRIFKNPRQKQTRAVSILTPKES